ncbi:MAG: hypothetical protein H6Q84_1076 [Deltaproteobacteria bacterium]|nr:hypothetical protein [Deltaproteobacteria bacterium]
MEPACWIDRRDSRPGTRASGILAALLLALCLLLAFPSFSPAEVGREATFEDRAAAEKLSRSRYRKLEVASLVIIFAAGAGAAFWAIRRRKP